MSKATEIPQNYKGEGGFPLNTFVTHPVQYVDGAVGTPNPPVPPPGNPFIDPETGERYPGAPGG